MKQGKKIVNVINHTKISKSQECTCHIDLLIPCALRLKKELSLKINAEKSKSSYFAKTSHSIYKKIERNALINTNCLNVRITLNIYVSITMKISIHLIQTWIHEI